MPPPVENSSVQVLRKKLTDVSIDLYNLSQQYVAESVTGAECLERFLASRASTSTEGQQGQQLMFDIDGALRSTEMLNDIERRLGRICEKFQKADGYVAAMCSLAQNDDVPNLMRKKLIELSKCREDLSHSLNADLANKRVLLIEAPLSTNDTAIALVATWRESGRLLQHHCNHLQALCI